MRFLALLVIVAVPSLSGAATPSYLNEVTAVLSRAGCNSGACHGNLNGKGGFRLSLRGENPQGDYVTLTRDTLARRIDPQNPDASLLLQKAVGRVPHEGGVRFAASTREYAILRDWIAANAPNDIAMAPRLVKLEVTPPRAFVLAPEDRVKLVATAGFADGSRRDVSGLIATETTNVGIARLLSDGTVLREQDGELVVLVRYLDRQVPVRIAFIPARPNPDYTRISTEHPIDRLAVNAWKDRRIEPSPVCSDEVFLRRAYLDVCGILPTADEVRSFLADRSADKRARLIDKLLARPEYAAYWGQKWSDLLRNEEKSLDHKGVQVFYRWIKGWIADDRPMTDFAREILAARGSTYENPAANFYRAVRDPYQRAESAAQVFLGLRVSCAKCHNHPFDRWTQDDYHRFVALFARIDYRVLSNEKRDKLDKHEFNGEQIVFAQHTGELKHPRGGDAEPKFLGAATPPLQGDADRLGALANWVADPANPYFAQAQVNRVWYHLLGRGLVDPNDDFRLSNPPGNPELLDHLSQYYRDHQFRLKPLIKHVMTSQVYQRSSAPNPTNGSDENHFARAVVQPLEAEQLLDALGKVFEVTPKFSGYPKGLRAGELPAPPQTGRKGSEVMSTRFLKVFGKPDRLLTCECERSEDPGMLQAFQLITGELLNSMLRDPNNRISDWLKSGRGDQELLDEAYLWTLARYPTDKEKASLLEYLERAKDRRAAWEDVMWGLVNAKEFLLRR